MPTRRNVLRDEDHEALRRAHGALEHPSLAARVSSILGQPIEQGLRFLPSTLYGVVQNAAEAAVGKALTVAVASLGKQPPAGAHADLHRAVAALTGAAGGFFGLPALVIELPLTTVIMLRAIADAAHRHGEDLRALETRLACMEVFAVGGRSHGCDRAEIGYYEVRAAIALHLTPLVVAKAGSATQPIPAAADLVRAIAARFGVVVSDKVALQMVPVLGAASGALINTVFMRHFQDVAEGHFTVRELERRYGVRAVEKAYRGITLRHLTHASELSTVHVDG